MKNFRTTGKRAAALLMTVMMLAALLPTVSLAAEYGVVTGDAVFFRQKASSSASFWEKLPNGWVMEIIGQTTSGGKTWYNIQGGVPSNQKRTLKGYILGDYFRPLTDSEAASWAKNPKQGTIKGTPATTDSSSSSSSSSSTSSKSVISNGSLVKTTAGGVNLRKSASSSASSVTSLSKGTVLAVSSYSAGWYYVEYGTKYGYVDEQYVSLLTDQETASYLKSLGNSQQMTVKTTGGTLTLRETRSTKASALALIPNKTVLPVYDLGSTWACTTYSGKVGWVLSSYLVSNSDSSSTSSQTADDTSSSSDIVISGETYAATVKTTGGTLTLRETESTSARALALIPNKTVLTVIEKGSKWCKTTYGGKVGYVLTSYLTFSNASDSLVAYVYVKTDKVYVRKEAKKSGSKLTQVNKGVFPMWGSKATADGYTWYPITANGENGYVRSDCAYQMTKAQYDSYTSSGKVTTPNPNDGKDSGYIRLTTDSVNIRAAAATSSAKMGQEDKGTVLKCSGSTTVSGVKWYKVTYLNTSCFVMAKYAATMTNAEYSSYQASLPTPTPTPAPTAVPNLSSMSDTAYTKVDDVFIRKSASQSATSVNKVYNAHTYVTLTGKVSVDNGVYWYEVTYGSTTGYIRGDTIYIMSENEKKAAGLSSSSSSSSSSTSSTGKYVKYTTLRLGSSGSDVKKMQQALAAQGYLKAADVTGTYTTATKNAVIAFQKANKLSQDGVAGQLTLSALYGTPAYDTSSVDTTLYPVEKVDWYKGDIQKVWAKGTVAVITDVKTGKSFKAKRWSGGAHADVEPLTAADTAIMCQIYGVSNAQQILEKNLYQRRPLWVTVGGRSFAASMYGVPHNYPAGDTIANNNYNGQFCVHFVNSRVHASNKVDADHQAAIDYAYKHAPSRK